LPCSSSPLPVRSSVAAPVTILSGVSRAARAGVIVKGGAAVQQLGEARTVVLDKTGTLTLGLPEVGRLVTFDGFGSEETLRLAASIDQLSAHSLAEALVHAALSRGLVLSFPGKVAGRLQHEHRLRVGQVDLMALESGGIELERRTSRRSSRARAAVGSSSGTTRTRRLMLCPPA
jgi:cation transport ATPase